MEERAMAEGGRREEIDATIARWERELEGLRVALANASEALNARHHSTFVELYRLKEVAKSRWETVRGVYRPDAHAVRRCEEALAAMAAAWQQTELMLSEMRPTKSA